MLFNSLDYFIFLPLAVGAYWTLPSRWRIHALVVLSYVFYATWSLRYAAMMFGVVLINWFGAQLALRFSRMSGKIIATTIGIDLAILGLFKYFDFAVASLVTAASWTPLAVPPPSPLGLILPLGISFFTFEFIHFLIDVKRGEVPRCGFSAFHVFSAFFPTQIAGPIKRFQDFLPQLDRVARIDGRTVAAASILICQGLFKK